MFRTLWEMTHDVICMPSETVKVYADTIFHNMDVRDRSEKNKMPMVEGLVSFDMNGELNHLDVEAKTVAGDAMMLQDYGVIESGDTVVNIVSLVGPMTRCGDDCTVGTIELRDKIKRCAQIEGVKAHIIYTMTPGGMASCLIDMRDAIDFCHKMGQKVYMYCDGDVFSCGAFTACMCDGIYTASWDHEIGSLGGMMAGFIPTEGAENAITKDRYVEVYGSKSCDKNYTHREAMKGNLKPMQEHLDKFLDKALAQCKKDRQCLRADQLTGKTYRMGDVKGSMVDGKMTLGELIRYAVR